MTILRGACHCGQIEVDFETASPVNDLRLRACSCSFCRRHHSKAVADPNGRLTIYAPTGGLHRYRFGMRTADYLICGTCGVYIAAVIANNGQERATLNVVGAGITALADRPAEPADYDHESVEGRRARRLAGWTPSRVAQRTAQAGVG
ncbi:MAG TPA: hypothetical protein VFB29_11100 [Pseudolabrys sp.]|nr:hypothetical protein [Pseudolabrys sp.]